MYLADGRPVYSNAASATTRVLTTLSNGVPVNNITLIDVGSNSSYNALDATYTHRLSAGLTTSASYTWSHSISDAPEGNTYQFSASVEDPSNPFRDRGRSSVNRPDAFTFSTVYSPKVSLDNRIARAFANGNELAVLGNFLSGDPQNETSSVTLNGDSTATSRPLFVGRNTLVSPVVAQVDARFTRAFASFKDRVNMRVIVEATNVLNRSNFITVSSAATVQGCVITGTNLCSNALTPAAGSQYIAGQIIARPSLVPTAGLDARILQFGLKIDF